MGTRKRFHIVLQIVGFLIASVGILFFCQYLSHALNNAFETEGFQVAPTADQTATCNLVLTGDPTGQTTESACSVKRNDAFGRTIYYCPREIDAIPLMDPSSFCLLNDNDTVCISSMNFGGNYYTCYRRPPQKVFDTTYGVWNKADFLLDHDTAPTDLAPNIDFVCAAYAGNTINVIKQLMSTIAVRNTIQNIIISTSKYSEKFDKFYTTFCGTNLKNTLNNGQLICDKFSEAKIFFAGLPDVPIVKDQTLNTISTATNYSVSSLSNVSTNISNSFKGFKCDTNLFNKYTVSTYIINS